MFIAANCSWAFVYCVIILCVPLLPNVYLLYCLCICCTVCVYCCTVCVLLYCVCIAVFTLDDGLLASSQYSEGPATGHLDRGFSRFPCVYKQTLSRFPTFQVATTCFSCSPPDLNLLDPYFMSMYMHNNHCHRVTAYWQLNILLLLLSIWCVCGPGSSVTIVTQLRAGRSGIDSP
jgi:hypothetical protein